MDEYRVRPKGSSYRGIFHLLLLFALLLSVLPSHDIAGQLWAQQKLHPLLRSLAAQDGNQTVRVIVQQNAPDQRLAVNWKESIVRELPIIHGLVLEMPAKNLPRLAADPAVRAISLDAPVIETGGPCRECIDTDTILDAYTKAIGAHTLWNTTPYLQGKGVTIAVVDSGIAEHNDLGRRSSRVLAHQKFNSFTNNQSDRYGHGTHVAGIIAGDGSESRGARVGVAPKANLVNVKISSDKGAGTTADLVNGLQWVLQNKDAYNIRVVNISLNSSVAESYLTNPISAAIEILWFNGIVVVVSAGNNGSGNNNGILYPPANDPFVITVGATDDKGTPSISDDVLASFSAYGVTAEGFAKPDIVAPGTDIISLLAGTGVELAQGHPDHRVDGFAGGKDHYFRISGTSMAAAVVSGAVALLLQDEPGLNPDQVKHRLMATARPFAGPAAGSTGAGYLDIYAAVHGNTRASANTGIAANQLLLTGSQPIVWGSVNWNSVNWNSVNWNSVNWNSVNWNSVNWNSLYWDDGSAKSASVGESGLGKNEPGAADGQPRIFLPAVSAGR